MRRSIVKLRAKVQERKLQLFIFFSPLAVYILLKFSFLIFPTEGRRIRSLVRI